MTLTTTENILSPNFFRKIQQLNVILRTIPFFDELNSIANIDEDEFTVTYDETVNLHVLLHYRPQHNETRAICYMNTSDFSQKRHAPLIYAALRHAWIEDLI